MALEALSSTRFGETMKATRGIIACVVLSVLAISWMVASSSTRASADSDKAAIVALNRRIADAIGRGDLEAVMACYVEAKNLVFLKTPSRSNLKVPARSANIFTTYSWAQATFTMGWKPCR